MQTEKKVGIGLIGAGWIGNHHGHNVIKNPHAEFLAVADPKAENAQAFLQSEGISAAVYADYEDMLKRDDIDAVIICSPNSMHAEHAISAASAGKHIFLEKPMAINIEDCRRMVKVISESGVKCEMGYHRRLNPLYQHAKQLVDEGKLGDLVLAESDYIQHVPGDHPRWEWAGKKALFGSPINSGTGHNIDLLRFFCGEVEEVSCFKDIRMPRKVQLETEDIATVILKFKNKTLARMVCFIGPIMPFTFTLKLFGTKGSLDNNRLWFDSTPLFYDYGHENDFIELPKAWIPDNVQGGVSETWDKCMNMFIDNIRFDRKPFNDHISGFNTAAVAFAAVESAEDGKVVKPETL
ncbi:MAG: Gfo/Idh/MocA family protein [Armatimonadota bacterium]